MAGETQTPEQEELAREIMQTQATFGWGSAYRLAEHLIKAGYHKVEPEVTPKVEAPVEPVQREITFRIKDGVKPYAGRRLRNCTEFKESVSGYIVGKWKTYGPYSYRLEELEDKKYRHR